MHFVDDTEPISLLISMHIVLDMQGSKLARGIHLSYESHGFV